MKEYKMTKKDSVLGLIILVIGLSSILAFIIALFIYGDAAAKIWILFGILPICIAVFYLRLASMTTAITIRDNLITFKNVIGRVIVPAQDIKSVEKILFTGMIGVQHRGGLGKIQILREVEGIADFISTLKVINPSIVIKGF